MADVLAALTGQGSSDDSLSPEANENIQYTIRAIAESGLSFKVDGTPKTAAETSEWMLQSWRNAVDPVYSAEMLIYRTAGHEIVDKQLNRVVFADGTEQSLTDWLLVKLAEHTARRCR